MKKLTILIIGFILICSCKKETETPISIEPKQIVVIAKYAPKKYIHLLKQDSLGKNLKDSLGIKMFRNDNGFAYLDNNNRTQLWKPKSNTIDTLVIPYNKEFLELSSNNPYTLIKESFLIKNGDTVIFDYEHNIPRATIVNRIVNDTALNYNKYRLKTLFSNKYTSHSLIVNGFMLKRSKKDFRKITIDYYQKALEDAKRERQLLKTLAENKTISKLDYNYRISTLNGLMEKHKNLKPIKEHLALVNGLNNNVELLKKAYNFDLSKTDSLMTFSFFRDYLLYNISKYNLPTITINNGNSGASFIDSRVRFDSILQDKRFNQTTKDLLLFDAFNGIARNFKIKDKKKYFKKLQEETTDRDRLNKLIKDFNIDFNKSDILLLTSRNNDTLTYKDVIKNNKGKWLYVDFWASWCTPCRKTMPASRKLKKDLKNKEIEFIYFSLNDKKEKWKQAIIADSIQEAQHYFIENGNTSKIIEDLNIKTIPHYIIYNPKGEVVNGFAKRPGKDAKQQLESYISTENRQ